MELGVAAGIAHSFGGIFYRNACNLGLPAIVSRDVDQITADQILEIDLRSGSLKNKTNGDELTSEAVPENLMALIEAGGLVPFLENKLTKKS